MKIIKIFITLVFFFIFLENNAYSQPTRESQSLVYQWAGRLPTDVIEGSDFFRAAQIPLVDFLDWGFFDENVTTAQLIYGRVRLLQRLNPKGYTYTLSARFAIPVCVVGTCSDPDTEARSIIFVDFVYTGDRNRGFSTLLAGLTKNWGTKYCTSGALSKFSCYNRKDYSLKRGASALIGMRPEIERVYGSLETAFAERNPRQPSILDYVSCRQEMVTTLRWDGGTSSRSQTICRFK